MAVTQTFGGGRTDEERFGLRCRHCARTQPPHAATSYRCVFCGAPLPVRRWIAHPPPGVRLPRRVRLVRRPYTGAPSYRGNHPRWGFPLVAWRDGTIATEPGIEAPKVRGLLVLTIAAALTAIACGAAAVAEAWRFSLLLAGRTKVLAGQPVHASDVMVAVAGTSALVLAVVTASVTIPVMVALHRAAAFRAGRTPGRSGAAIVARLVVPGWNLYGAGQILLEIVHTLAQSDSRKRSARIVAPLWWIAWVANGLLVVVTLVMAFGRSNQIVADTVEMHIAVDVVAGLVAALLAAVMASLSRSWAGRGGSRYDGWAVGPPLSTARNRAASASRGGHPVAGDETSGDETSGEPAGDETAGDEASGERAGDETAGDGTSSDIVGDETTSAVTGSAAVGVAHSAEPDARRG